MTATNTHTAPMARQLLTDVQAWDAEHRGEDGSDLWNDLLYSHPLVDQEASPEYDSDSAVVCWDGSRIAWTRDGWVAD